MKTSDYLRKPVQRKIWPKLTVEILEQGVKYVQSQ